MRDEDGPASLPAEALRQRCDPETLPFEAIGKSGAGQRIIGQDRAVRAIRLGLKIPSPGYNIFVVGNIGTGRHTAIKRFLDEIPRDGPAPPDLLYVHNFKEPDQPRLLTLTAGRGSQFRDAIHGLVAHLRRVLPEVFESPQYEVERKAVLEGYKERQKGRVKEFEAKAAQESFRVVQTQMGPIVRPALVPVIGGSPVGPEQLQEMIDSGKLPQQERERIEARREELGEELERLFKELRQIDQEAKARCEQLDRDIVVPLVHDPLLELRRQYEASGVERYLDELEEDIISNLDRFRDQSEPSEPSQEAAPADPFAVYRVNLLVDNSATKGAPVVKESSPTHKNLFGAIERVVERMGEVRSTLTHVKAGSLLKASGGYLVLNAHDVMAEPGVWAILKRTLRTGLVEIQSFDPGFMFATSVIKPEPIQVKVKVLMVGDHRIYTILYHADPEFRKIFKIKAEFDTVMKATDEALADYVRFVQNLTATENLTEFDSSAVAAIVEHGRREAASGGRLSTKFAEIADVIRESAWLAQQQSDSRTSAEHVEAALQGRRDRVSLAQSKGLENVEEGRLLVNVDGEAVGQVNAMAIYDDGEYAFGLPSRITATLSMGRAGIVNIEREVELSGPFHSKGVLILSGYLRSLFAQDKPLTLSASLCFEQSYAGIEGDSASCAEVYALLSILSGAPIFQGFAVTGSVDQMGVVQAIGGVNEKIEGWFAACKARGRTGRQGALIPAANVADLMLDNEIVEAARAGSFAIIPLNHVEQGIRVLTGIEAGARSADGRFPEDSIFGRADARLKELAESLRRYGPLGRDQD